MLSGGSPGPLNKGRKAEASPAVGQTRQRLPTQRITIVLRRTTLLASAAVAALLLLGSAVEAAPRHKRLKHKECKRHIPTIKEQVMKVFPKGKILSMWGEEKGEVEVMVGFPSGRPIEVVFKNGRLIGYEFPVATDSLPPLAQAALQAKYPKAKYLEVEVIFGRKWDLLGYQVAVAGKGEVFVTAAGQITKDPL
jgi:hypothetical protein